MRQMLVDYARRRKAQKRGGAGDAWTRELLDRIGAGDDPSRALAIGEAMERLAERDARAAEVVDMRVFSGRTAEETAQLLGVSLSTVKADWKLARAFLYRELQSE